LRTFLRFPRNLAPDFTHYLSERPELTSHDEEARKAKTTKEKEIKFMKNQNIMFTRSIPQISKGRLVTSALALGIVALIMQASVPCAQAFDPSSLNGAYADSSQALGPVHGGPLTMSAYMPFYVAGLFTFDGAGGFTASLVFNFGGGAIANPGFDQTATGTYTVNANGTGTLDWMAPPGVQRRRHFVIGDGGNELKYIGTDPTTGILSGGTMVKQ
jgi:hypothetical protein